MQLMTKLFCGHNVSDALYSLMFRAKVVRCPKCGLEWRGWMVIDRDKTLPKRELNDAIRRANEGKKRREDARR